MVSAASVPITLSHHHRKSTGAYYTPQPLIDLLLDHVVPHASNQIRILDPACGPGDFLLAAARRFPGCQIYGIDVNPEALAQCEERLKSARIQNVHLSHADALLNPPPILQPQSFDLIIGNPPFVNAIEKYFANATKCQLRRRYPVVKGAADLACYFLHQATTLIRPGGQIAVVLPRALLNSPATESLRQNLPAYLKPNLIYAPERHDFFPGAAVFITLLILGPHPTCKVSSDPNPATAKFTTGPLPTTTNWWQYLHDILRPKLDVRSRTTSTTLGQTFDLHASMTAGEAYALLPHLIDSPIDPGQKLITTGLINPNTCHWGQTRCRYLKRDFFHPVIPPNAPLPPSLQKRIAKSKRPKILLAGLTKRIECFLDQTGQYTGAVGTFSIYHPADNLAALGALSRYLLTPAVTQHVIQTLGANALRGAHITLKKNFLRALPAPPQSDGRGR